MYKNPTTVIPCLSLRLPRPICDRYSLSILEISSKDNGCIDCTTYTFHDHGRYISSRYFTNNADKRHLNTVLRPLATEARRKSMQYIDFKPRLAPNSCFIVSMLSFPVYFSGVKLRSYHRASISSLSEGESQMFLVGKMNLPEVKSSFPDLSGVQPAHHTQLTAHP